MWLEIIITLLLGGLFYILVAQRNSKPTKRFRVTNSKRDRTVLLKYTSFESFSAKCRDQFNISKKEKLCFASDEDENLELDEECLVHLEDKFLLIAKGETARHNDDDHDENDDSLEFESHGSDSFTGDTIVDHGTMKRSEDIQAGRAKYDLGKNEKLYSAFGEDENIELDEKCLVEDKALLIVKGTTSGPNDVDDKNDDKLGFKIPGSDSLTGDTVVHNADIQKWDDIQSEIKEKEKLCFASDEDKNLELDDECLVHLEDKSLLIAKGETARHNDDDHDENDGSFEFESHGSDSFTGDTIVDHGTMKKSEDIQAGRAKYDLGQNEKLYSAFGEDENIELDEKGLVEDKALLIVKGMTSGPNDVDDKTDDKLGSKIPGSDSLTGDTVVDNADIQKWEDIQSEIKEKEKLCFASDEDENLELDEECLVHLEDKSLLIAKGETARHNDDDHDENDDSLEFESHGSDSFTGDTIVDHGTMKKSEGIQAGRAKYDLGRNEKLYSASGEDENIEQDEKCLVDLEDKSLLIVKGMTSGPNDVDDENNDWLGIEISGSDSLSDDTVVDNADIQKWEDIQSGSEVKEHIIKYGLRNITGVLKENMDAWKSKPLNIAVTGESGKGKSSFINAFRGMSPGQEGAAEVGEEECTTDCRAFRHPKYDSFVLWDVPGVGTITFPKENYLNAIQVDRYDFFIIISSNRFSELDSWLAKTILRRKKKFYFIRTKVDNDMSEMKKRFRKMGKQFLENEEFDKLKSKISEKLYCDVQIENLQFFMISNHHSNKYDFPLILKQLLHDVPVTEKDAMLFGLAGMSQDILVEKASALKSRIWKVTLLSGAGAAIPIPFISTSIDTALILEEVLFYREQFGLDDQSLKHLADMAGISLVHLKSSVKFRTPADLFTLAGLAKVLMKYAAGEVAETVVKFTIPVIGAAISCGISFSTTMRILESLLEVMKQDALKVLMYVTTGKTETEID